MKDQRRPASVGLIVTAVLLGSFSIAYLAVALLTLGPASRNVPLLAGGFTLALLVLELSRSWTERRNSSDDVRTQRTDRNELTVLMSVAALVTGIYLLGFVVALPLYVFAAIRYIGKRSLRAAIATALITTATLYVAFAVLLSYRLFPGVLFA